MSSANTVASVIELVKDTPLIRLNSISDATGCNILGKAEFLNPCGSIKDRVAIGMIRELEKEGKLKKGDLVVEATGGNTGIALAMLCPALGYRALITVTTKCSDEKVTLMRTMGADVRVCPMVPYSDPAHYQNTAQRLAKELGGVCPNQFDNLANFRAHYNHTGPEILTACPTVDAFICCPGTGGSIAGVSVYLKEKKPNVLIGYIRTDGADHLVDPESKLVRAMREEEKDGSPSTIFEGISPSRIFGNLAQARLDCEVRVTDSQAIKMGYYIAQNEGLLLGGSSALNVAGAYLLAKKIGPGHTLVTFICDSGKQYMSKMYNPEFLKENNLPGPHGGLGLDY